MGKGYGMVRILTYSNSAIPYHTATTIDCEKTDGKGSYYRRREEEIERRVIRKVSFGAGVPWDRLSELVQGVITPLRREGAQISSQLAFWKN